MSIKIKVKLLGTLVEKFGFKEKTFKIEKSSKLKDLLSIIGIEDYRGKIIIRNSNSIWPDDSLEDNDTIIISSTSSGG